MYTPTAKIYFAGGGGVDQGMTDADIDVIQSVEYEPTFADTLRLNFRHKVITQDICTLPVRDQMFSDIHGYTYPCTKYSTSANLHGTRTGDELFLHALRHLAIERPAAYFVENVPGMRKFPIVMEAMTMMPDYYTQVFCPVDALTWLPQRRKRLIIIATLKPFAVRPPQNTRRVTLREIIEENPQVHIPENVYSRMRGNYRDLPIISDPNDRNAVAPTCVAHYAKDRGTRLLKDKRFPMGVRPYSVREYARLQGFPDHFNFAGTEAQQYTQIGNAVPVHMARWIGTELHRYFNL